MKNLLQKIPFAVRIYLTLDVWAILCSLFGLLFIINQIKPESFQVKKELILILLALTSVAAIFAPAEYGLLRFIGIKGKKDAQILNDNITGNQIHSNVSNEALRQIFISLYNRPFGGIISSLKYGGGVTILTTLGALLIRANIVNVIIIFLAGVIATTLLTTFANFFVERSISPILKECQKMLKKRSIKVEEIPRTTLKSRFNYFILLFFLIFIVFFSFIHRPSLGIISIGLIALIMVSIISKVLFSSIYDIFLEVENFAEKLPKREKAFYLTGNLTKESIVLSNSLNTVASSLYDTREKILFQARELRKSYEEIKKRKEDLEKFYKLTVGRELKMIELKKRIKEMEEKLRQ